MSFFKQKARIAADKAARVVFSALIVCAMLPLSCFVEQAQAKASKLIGIEVYATATDSHGDWVDPDKPLDREKQKDGTYKLKNAIKEKGGQVRLLLEMHWSGGAASWQYEENHPGVLKETTYKVTSGDAVTVTSSGMVTARNDGTSTVTVTAKDSYGNSCSSTLAITAAGQSGSYVKEVYVTNEKGKQYEEERIVMKSPSRFSLYFREVMSDGTTVSNAPKASDYAPKKLTSHVWAVSDSQIATVNSDSGNVVPKAQGSFKVYITVSGGDPGGRLKGKVRSYVWVNIDDGKYNPDGDMPSDELTVKVVYDLYPDHVVASKHYTLAELKKLKSGTGKSTYTFTRSEGQYVTASGEGVYLSTLIDAMKVKTSQIKSFTFKALDGVNPGKMSYSFLFGERYYWPNYEFNQNHSDAKLVFPMLAWESDWREAKDGATDSGADYSNLGTGTRLRLLFGSSSDSDGKTDKSLKYISEMTIRIEGAPDAGDGDGDDGKNTGDKGNGSSANGGGDNGGDASGNPNAKGSVTNGDENGENVAPSDNGNNAAQAKGSSIASKGDNDGDSSSSSQKWKVYQVLNPEDETGYQIEALDDNPLERWTPLILLLVFAAGSGCCGYRYRRQVIR